MGKIDLYTRKTCKMVSSSFICTLATGLSVILLGVVLKLDIQTLVYDTICNEKVHVYDRRSTDLAIAVLSARRNILARQAVRETWMTTIRSSERLVGVNVYFVVGIPCHIHPDNRLDVQDCQANEWTSLENTDNIPLVSRNSKIANTHQQNIIVSNISLTVKHPIVISRLGLFIAIQLSKSPIKVVLYDDVHDVEIAGVRFNVLDEGMIVDGYRYQPVEPVMLPEGFKGSFRVMQGTELILNKSSSEMNSGWKMNNYGGAVYLQSLDHDALLKDLGDYNHCTYLISVQASIFDVHQFNSRVRKMHTLNEQHKVEEDKISSLLEQEIQEFNDILVVNVVDIYRNLPIKLLTFHKWLNTDANVSPSFILKTDDDCFLDIESIFLKIAKFKTDRKVWWSNFRDDWYVERYGKWAELDFIGSTYPRFACGSGNIVSADISQWLALNFDYLKPYQGEDVSMGIWLSAIGPSFIVDSTWQCDKTCTKDSLVIPELEPQELRAIWKSKLECGNPCGCD